MDVIQPQLIRIANRCYRKNPVAPSWGTTEREIELRASENDPKLSGPCMYIYTFFFKDHSRI